MDAEKVADIATMREWYPGMALSFEVILSPEEVVHALRACDGEINYLIVRFSVEDMNKEQQRAVDARRTLRMQQCLYLYLRDRRDLHKLNARFGVRGRETNHIGLRIEQIFDEATFCFKTELSAHEIAAAYIKLPTIYQQAES